MNLTDSIHIGIIPDGNRRWCTKNNTNMFDLIKTLCSMIYKNYDAVLKNKENATTLCKIREISLYVLSKDNLTKRKDNTIEIIRHIMTFFLDNNESKNFENLNIRFVGEKHLLPDDLQTLCDMIEKKTYKGTFTITIAIGYDPIEDSKKLLNYDTSRCYQTDIDLVIRTGGEKRSSGFFPIKTLYSEWIYLDKLWPDLTIYDLEQCIKEFSTRERRFGG